MTDLIITLGGIALAALAGWIGLKRRDKRVQKEVEAKAKEADHAKADAVRDRVRDARRVPADPLRYRD
jgi:LPXTG-motif cell wall-anchored protein